MTNLTFKIQAEEQDFQHLQAESANYEIRKSFVIQLNQRGETKTQEFILDRGELIEFHYEDGTNWICDEDTLEELFPDYYTNQQKGFFEIPLEITEEGISNRGIFKKILLKIVNILAKKVIEVGIKELAERFDESQVGGKSGLFLLQNNFELLDLPKNFDLSKPYLLFIHGTASNTIGSFGKLRFNNIDTPEWKFLQNLYPNQILAFQHETLSKSPLLNALELVKQLPNGIVLDLVTSSRGGLIGDIISLYSATNIGVSGFNLTQKQLLEKEKRKNDLESIDKLDKLFSTKKITINRFVRVGCPAAGTSLASKRLSTFFNILTNVIGFTIGNNTNPIFVILKSLLTEIINTKNEPDVLPGIEAQRLESPFIKALNCPTVTGTSDKLFVISSNAVPKFNLRGVLIVVSRAVFKGKNDLVVDTESMYQGARRSQKIHYHFEQETDIYHLDYFHNADTRAKLQSALEPIINLSIFKEFSQDEIPNTDRNVALRLFGAPGGGIHNDTVSYKRPVLILIPGIMGSVLSENNSVIWLDFFKIVGGQLNRLAIENKDIRATAIIESSYGKFLDAFSKNYDVITFGFDWRKSLQESANLFNTRINELLKSNLKIQIVAHSMGGLLFRDFILNHPETWQRLNSSHNFRIIYLGTPFKGSYRIPAVLTGKDDIIKSLSLVDLINSKAELISTFLKFEGIHNLLPLTTNEGNDFARKETWLKLQNAANEGSELSIISDLDLKKFRAYRTKVLSTIDSIDYSNMVYIAGKGDKTADSYEIIEFSNQKKELRFGYTSNGDESVTWESGIPQKIKNNNAVYYVDVTHGSLANTSGLFDGINDILRTGKTNKFSKTNIEVSKDRSIKTSIQPEMTFFDKSQVGIERAILGLTKSPQYINTLTSINVSVSKGDLIYSSYPIMVGHFKGDGILSAESVIDNYLENILTEKRQFGLYPEEIGQSEVFISGNTNISFKGAIIIGLGEVGEFTSSQLKETVEQAITNYLFKIYFNKNSKKNKEIGVSTLIIGSGYGGLPLETSICSIIEGVNRANEKFRVVKKEDAPTIKYLEFIERMEDKALSCFQILTKIEKINSERLPITIKERKIKSLVGGIQKRLTFESATNDWWNIITVTNEIKNGKEGMAFSLSTHGAKEDKRSVFVNSSIINDLLKTISIKNQFDKKISKAIFEQLIPNEFKDYLMNNIDLIWMLDEKTAEYPWELLQSSLDENSTPLSVSSGMIRKLITRNASFKNTVISENIALVVGDPILDNQKYRQLDGAKDEAIFVTKKFEANSIKTVSLIRDEASTILVNLSIGGYKYLHLAGHGQFSEDSSLKTGMVIGNSILTVDQINQIRPVPEFTFINCCELGEINSVSEQKAFDAFRLAANIGTQLILNGVKAVVVAGWSVGDQPALTFSQEFYNFMFEGYTLGEATRKAREKLFDAYGYENNTWGAYQCYGDQFYKFNNEKPSVNIEYDYATPEQAEYDLYNFLGDLERGTTFKNIDVANKAFENIQTKINFSSVRSPQCTELEAKIYFELGDYKNSILKYEELIKNESSTFTVKSLEEYCNIRSKYCVELLETSLDNINVTNQLDSVINDLKQLLSISETYERFNLLGSAFKRKGLISKEIEAKKECYKTALGYYTKASRSESVYSLSNIYNLTYFLEADSIPVNIHFILGSLLSNLDTRNLSYWDLVSRFNLLLTKYIICKDVDFSEVKNEYVALRRYAGTIGKKKAEKENIDIIMDLLKSFSPGDIAIQTLNQLIQ
ncbi:CHAT domain-containing protein [Flectobacillus longus]|uniref:CHAT domain-containing protein n=1 Tax=Flectobacillus longus TaxID=2984207 RepID=UPI0024B6EAFF|nr:CHAT domain-containing protein [Flectobacillus longus]MDI9879380.1 CHAT domain-containing protein [Flectobacillus longus]